MKRNTINFWIDLISFIVMLGLVLTGLLIHYILPPGSGGHGGGAGLTLWGMGRHDYGDIHFYLALVMVALMAVHIWLHWSWVCAAICGLTGCNYSAGLRHNCYGIALLLSVTVLVLGGLCWTKTQVRSVPRTIAREHSPQDESSFVTGQTTLTQAARIAGIPAAELIRKLNLPPDTDPDERLGRLRRRYGLELYKIRTVVQQTIDTRP